VDFCTKRSDIAILSC